MSTPPSRGPPPEAEREIQEMLAHGENLQQDYRALEEQRAYMEGLVRDLRRGRETLEAVGSTKAGETVLLPVGAGTFVRATLADSEHVLSTLGAGVILETKVPAALARVEERLGSAEQALTRIADEARKVEAEMSRINARLQQYGG